MTAIWDGEWELLILTKSIWIVDRRETHVSKNLNVSFCLNLNLSHNTYNTFLRLLIIKKFATGALAFGYY